MHRGRGMSAGTCMALLAALVQASEACSGADAGGFGGRTRSSTGNAARFSTGAPGLATRLVGFGSRLRGGGKAKRWREDKEAPKKKRHSGGWEPGENGEGPRKWWEGGKGPEGIRRPKHRHHKKTNLKMIKGCGSMPGRGGRLLLKAGSSRVGELLDSTGSSSPARELPPRLSPTTRCMHAARTHVPPSLRSRRSSCPRDASSA